MTTSTVSPWVSLRAAASMLLQRKKFRVVVVLSIVMGLASSFVSPFLSMFGTIEVGMSLPVFGSFMTVSTLSSVVFGTIISQRSDSTYSRRAVLIVGSACGALGYLAFAFVRDQWGLLLINVSVLAIASVTFSQIFAYARDLVDEEQVAPADAPLYLNTIRMFVALSWTVGPAIAAFSLDRFSFRGLFLTAAGLYAVLVLVLLVGVDPATPRASRAHPNPRGSFDVFFQPAIRRWFVAFVLIFSAQTMSMSNLSLLILNDLQGTEPQVGIAFSVAPVFELPLMLYAGLLATRLDSIRMIRAAAVLAAAYYAALSLTQAPWHIYVLQVLSAAIVSVTNGVAITFFQNRLPGQSGAATNLYVTAMRLGSTSGYLLFGVIANQFGHRGACLASAGLAIAAAGLMALPDDRVPAPHS